MKSKQKTIVCLLFTVVIVFATELWSQTSEVKQGQINMPSDMKWVVASSERGLYVYFFIKAPEPQPVQQEFILAEITEKNSSLLAAGKLPLEDANSASEFKWSILTPVFHLVDLSPPLALAVKPLTAGERTLFAVNVHGGGAPVIMLGSVSTQDLVNTLSKADPGKAGSRPLDGRIDWKTIGRFNYREAPDPNWYFSDILLPDLENFRNMLFLAGQCDYPGQGGAIKGIWVGRIENTTANTILGSLLGKGRGPALMSLSDKLYCLAIESNRSNRADRERISGRVVGWVSGDGMNWKNAGLMIDDANVAQIDACSYKDVGLIACLSYLPSPNIHIYEFDKSKNNARQIFLLDIGKNGRVEKSLKINIFKDNPYIFWEEIEGKTRKLLFKRVDLSN